jgi:hypothetical protein
VQRVWKTKKANGGRRRRKKRNSASLTQMFVFAHSRVFGELPALLF